MKKALRIGLATAGVAAGLSFAGASAASAQVSFHGDFPLPHGRISIGIGHSFAAGSYVPHGYRVYSRPSYGYGFYGPVFSCGAHGLYHSHWIPVRRHQRRWVILDSPSYYPYHSYRRFNRYHDGYGYGRRGHVDKRYYRSDRGHRFDRDHRDRRFDRDGRRHHRRY